MRGTKHKTISGSGKHLLSLPKMSYITSLDQRFSKSIAALHLAELIGTCTASKYHCHRRQDPHLLIIDHPFDWHIFKLFVGFFHPPDCMLDWTINILWEFISLCHFSTWHFSRQSLNISTPQESPLSPIATIVNKDTFNAHTDQYLQTNCRRSNKTDFFNTSDNFYVLL